MRIGSCLFNPYETKMYTMYYKGLKVLELWTEPAVSPFPATVFGCRLYCHIQRTDTSVINLLTQFSARKQISILPKMPNSSPREPPLWLRTVIRKAFITCESHWRRRMRELLQSGPSGQKLAPPLWTLLPSRSKPPTPSRQEWSHTTLQTWEPRDRHSTHNDIST